MAKTIILKQLADLLGIKISGLEAEIGVSNGAISKSINKDGDLTPLIKEKISQKYLDINKEWLETGEGYIFTAQANEGEGIKLSTPKQVIPLGKHAHSKLKPHEYAEAFKDWDGLPMYNTPITASFIATYRDEDVFQPQYYLHDPRFRDCDFGAIITGDSMHSEIRHGDFIACKEIVDTRFIVFGDIYYVVATNGLETCKYLNADPKSDDNYLLVPRNENISPSPIPKEMVLKMYKVRGIIRGY